MTNTDIKYPVLLFDGVCNLCNASVQWVLDHDPKGIFYFAALQSPTGEALLQAHGLSSGQFDTVVLVDGDRLFTRSDAALEICRRLGGWWSLLSIFYVVPRALRNAIYNWIARNRYRWFGKREACMMPRPEWRHRFL